MSSWVSFLTSNFLEFLTCIISIRLLVLEGDVSPIVDCLLSLTDNTSAEGWLRKSNFPPEGKQQLHFELAQELTELLMANNICLYSQWFAGVTNDVAGDTCSHEFLMLDVELTQFLNAKYQEQVPTTFKVSPLPDKIISKLLELLQQAKPQQMESPQQPMPKVTPTGNDGSSSCMPPNSSTILSLMDSVEENDNAYWDALPSPFEGVITVSPQEAMLSWFRAHVMPPSTTACWLQPSLPPTDPNLRRTLMERLHSFYCIS